jgi:Helix-turn-helix domain
VNAEGTKTRSAVDPNAVKAIAHPIRYEALRVFEYLGLSSPSEVARELGEPLNKVTHHVDVLVECEAIELVETRPVRGAVQHFYRPCTRSNVSDAIARLLPQELRRGHSAVMLGNISDRVEGAARAGTIDSKPERHISWMEFAVDEQGWSDLISSKADQLDREMEIQAESAARLAAGEEDGIKVLTTGLVFELPKD